MSILSLEIQELFWKSFFLRYLIPSLLGTRLKKVSKCSHVLISRLYSIFLDIWCTLTFEDHISIPLDHFIMMSNRFYLIIIWWYHICLTNWIFLQHNLTLNLVSSFISLDSFCFGECLNISIPIFFSCLLRYYFFFVNWPQSWIYCKSDFVFITIFFISVDLLKLLI